MLSEAEKHNVVDLLNTIPAEDLLDIARTTTSGIISAENQNDAVRIIVQHAEDVRSLLARKKITKTILFKYLHNKQVPFAAAIDKATLIDATIAYWQNGGANSSAIQASVGQNGVSQTSVNPPPVSFNVSNFANMCDELAFKFCQWFFAKLNENVVNAGGEKVVDDDFWDDAICSINLISGSESIQHSATGNKDIVALIATVLSPHKIYLSPNLTTDGLRAKCDPHGLVMILVCGTLHQSTGQCVGIFEQKFGLIKDPYASDNWKIKKLELNLLSKLGVTAPPVLPADLLAIEN